MKKVRDCLALVLLAVLAGCGGGSKSSSTPSPAPNPSPAPTMTSPVNAPTPVVLGGGGSVTGADILVPVAATPVTNAEVLGVTTSTTGSASNVGDLVHLGETASVLLFGPGLSNNMQVSISGPPDITIVPGSLMSIQSTDNPPVPGIAFQVVVSHAADLGARTVIMQSPNNDVTTFTGGLEVVP